MNNFLSADNIIFIGGAPRSGTTLVQRIIASHSQVYGGPEFDLIPKIIELRNIFLSSVENGRINKYLSKDDVNDLFSYFLAKTFNYKIGRIPHKTHISEKTPINITVFPELVEIIPHSHLVFVLRDPRAIVASMLKVGDRYKIDGKIPPFFTRNVRSAVQYINECWDAGHTALDKCQNIHLVYYEDVVTSPLESITKLVTQLELPFEKNMLDIKAYDMSEFKSGEQFWYSQEKLRAPISDEYLEAWQQQLTSYEKFIVNRRILHFHTITRYNLTNPASFTKYVIESIGYTTWFIRYRIRAILIKLGKSVYRKLS
ncbi:sulfotransferase family protein [Ferrovum myxofaciens]|uniref:sulfotransferase family protein n=1 Tax=Ferrovum myxofaciens TaxID=416213 RepID=UPI003EBD663C